VHVQIKINFDRHGPRHNAIPGPPPFSLPVPTTFKMVPLSFNSFGKIVSGDKPVAYFWVFNNLSIAAYNDPEPFDLADSRPAPYKGSEPDLII
jgi:hypothetical protein